MGQQCYSAEQWSAWIDQQRGSGLTIAAFCGSIGVSENSFYFWRRKLASRLINSAASEHVGRSDSDEAAASSFVPLSIVEAGGVTDRIEIELPCGALVRVPREEVLIRQTLKVLLEFGTTVAGQTTNTEPVPAAGSGGSSC